MKNGNWFLYFANMFYSFQVLLCRKRILFISKYICSKPDIIMTNPLEQTTPSDWLAGITWSNRLFCFFAATQQSSLSFQPSSHRSSLPSPLPSRSRFSLGFFFFGSSVIILLLIFFLRTNIVKFPDSLFMLFAFKRIGMECWGIYSSSYKFYFLHTIFAERVPSTPWWAQWHRLKICGRSWKVPFSKSWLKNFTAALFGMSAERGEMGQMRRVWLES